MGGAHYIRLRLYIIMCVCGEGGDKQGKSMSLWYNLADTEHRENCIRSTVLSLFAIPGSHDAHTLISPCNSANCSFKNQPLVTWSEKFVGNGDIAPIESVTT